jgi:hypothetical protein
VASVAVLSVHARQQRRQLHVGLLARRARRQARDGVEAMVAAVGAERGSGCRAILLGVGRQRRPQLRRSVGAVVERQAEAGRHHAHDGRRPPADLDRTPDDRRVGAEAALPELVPEHDDGRSVGPVLLLGERATEHRRDAEHAEEVRAHTAAAQPLRLPGAAGERRRAIGEQRDVGEGPHVGAVGLPLVVRQPRLVEPLPRAPHDRQALRSAPWQRREEHRLHDPEERRGGADPERQRQRGDDGEAGTPAQCAPGEARVLQDVVEPARAPLVAHLLLVAVDAPEGALRPSTRLVGRQPGTLVGPRLHLEVEPHLLVQLQLVLPAAHQRACRGPDLVVPRHVTLPGRRSGARG